MRQPSDHATRELPGLRVPKGHGRAKGPKPTPKVAKKPRASQSKKPVAASQSSSALTASIAHFNESPACTQEMFARLTGLTLRAVQMQVHRGYLPTMKLGKYRLINLVAWRALLHAEATPIAVAPGKSRVNSRGAH